MVQEFHLIIIKRHGKPVAELVHPQDLENIERLKKAGPEGGLASLAGGWEGSDELVQVLDESVRYGISQRKFAPLLPHLKSQAQ